MGRPGRLRICNLILAREVPVDPPPARSSDELLFQGLSFQHRTIPRTLCVCAGMVSWFTIGIPEGAGGIKRASASTSHNSFLLFFPSSLHRTEKSSASCERHLSLGRCGLGPSDQLCIVVEHIGFSQTACGQQRFKLFVCPFDRLYCLYEPFPRGNQCCLGIPPPSNFLAEHLF